MSHLSEQFPKRFKQLIQDQVVESGIHDTVKHLVFFRKNFIALCLRLHVINLVSHFCKSSTVNDSMNVASFSRHSVHLTTPAMISDEPLVKCSPPGNGITDIGKLYFPAFSLCGHKDAAFFKAGKQFP